MYAAKYYKTVYIVHVYNKKKQYFLVNIKKNCAAQVHYYDEYTQKSSRSWEYF